MAPRHSFDTRLHITYLSHEPKIRSESHTLNLACEGRTICRLAIVTDNYDVAETHKHTWVKYIYQQM